LMALAGMKVDAGQEAGEILCQVRVFLEGQQIAKPRVLFRAEAIATSMFAGIGVRVRWEVGSPRAARGKGKADIMHYPGLDIVLRLVSDEAGNSHQGALGYALPYAQSGVQITLFFDRVLGPVVGSEGPASALLAHALVHEITHVLQGVARHSAEGVMKARWTSEDKAQMKERPLPFSAEDVQLIRLSMAARDEARDEARSK